MFSGRADSQSGQSTRRAASVLSCCVAACFISGIACAQGVEWVGPDDEQEPQPRRVICSDPVLFRALFREAQCRTVRAVVLGDSQETSPNGAGDIYIPRLQYELWSLVGNAPETPLAPMARSTGGGAPYADWLVRTANPDGGVLPLDRGTFFPPGWQGCRASTRTGSTINPGQAYGNFVQLQHNCADVNLDARLRMGANYMRTDGEVYAEVLALTGPGSGELSIRVIPSDGTATNYNLPVVQTFTSSMGLDQPGQSVVRSQRFGPLDFDGKRYMNIDIAGTHPDRFTDVLGVRFVNASAPSGWSLVSFSSSGYQAADFMFRHGQSWPIMRALDPDVMFITYGANDAGRTVTPTEYRNNIGAFIHIARAVVRPDLKVVIIPDPYRDGLSTHQQSIMNEYVNAVAELTIGDPRTCVVDSRAELAVNGWRMGTQWDFLADGVHYSARGATEKAAADVRLLRETFTGTMQDCNGNGTDDLCDIRAGVLADRDGDGVPDVCDCNADYNGDGGADATDLIDMAGDIASGTRSFPPRTPDFNEDGGADTTDLIDLADTVAGGGCP